MNEPLGSQFGARRVDGVLLTPNVWFKKIGPDYIKLAFEHARRVDPDAKLIINDWGADFLGQDYNKHDRVREYYKLVTYLIEQGTPIDGVGFQFHLEPGLDYPRSRAVVENFERYAALGLSTHITELDVRLRKPVTAAGLKRQAALFSNVFLAALKSPSTKDVVLWGFTDRYSWITAGTSFRDYGRRYDHEPRFAPLSFVRGHSEATRRTQVGLAGREVNKYRQSGHRAPIALPHSWCARLARRLPAPTKVSPNWALA